MDAELIYLIGLDWAEFALRWLHVVTAIAWIGSSFYFIALDLGLRKDRTLPDGVHGEEWQVHGGGFYHIQKYLVAPAALPEHLTWFKWESYATWLSGFALMVVVYYLGAELYLVDLDKSELPAWSAILISLGVLAVGWVGYDLLCKSSFGQQTTALMLTLYILLVIMAYSLDQIFTGRAAFLHLGAVTATIMSFNVLVIIIPNQRIVVADLKAGHAPDARYGQIAKQRSTHNNYLTLPVIFFMLSNHYPLAYSTDYSWVIAALVFLMGVSIRHYFNSRHARQGNPLWTWAIPLACSSPSLSYRYFLPLWTRVKQKRQLQPSNNLQLNKLHLPEQMNLKRSGILFLAAAACAMRASRIMSASSGHQRESCLKPISRSSHRQNPSSCSLPCPMLCHLQMSAIWNQKNAGYYCAGLQPACHHKLLSKVRMQRVFMVSPQTKTSL